MSGAIAGDIKNQNFFTCKHTINNFKQLEIKTAKSNGAVEKVDEPFGGPRAFGQGMHTATATSVCLFWQKQNFQTCKKLKFINVIIT